MNRLDNSPLFIALMIFTLASYLFSTLAFIVSKWYARWPGSVSTFEGIGLWEVCFNSYMSEDIYDQIYSDCFYTSSSTISDLYSFIMQDWLRASQITFTLSYVALMVATLVCTLMCFGLLNMKQKINAIVLICLHCVSLITCLVTLILFGINTKDLTEYQWMPNPQQCTLSWSYGSAALALLGNMICLGLLSHALRFRQNNYILWMFSKKAKYQQNLGSQLDTERTPTQHVSIYDPRGTSSGSKITGDRNQSLLSSRLGQSRNNNSKSQDLSIISSKPGRSHNNMSKSQDLSIISAKPGPPHTKTPKQFERLPETSTITSKPRNREKSPQAVPIESYKKSEKPSKHIEPNRTGQISSPAASQLTVTSRNASSEVIAAKPMRRN